MKEAKTFKKGLGSILSIFIASHIFNKISIELRGSPVVADPIEAVLDAYEIGKYEEGFRRVWRPAGRLAGEFLSNVPFGQTAAKYYPEYGTDILPAKQELFGTANPSRFGIDPLITKSIKEPLYYLLPGFGGSQIKKTKEGIESLRQEFVSDKAGSKLFDLPASLKNIIQVPIFGKYSTKEGREFFDSKDSSELIPAKNILKKQNKTNDELKVTVKRFLNNNEFDEALLTPKGIDLLVDGLKEKPNLTQEQKLFKQMNAENQALYVGSKFAKDKDSGVSFLRESIKLQNVKEDSMPIILLEVQKYANN